MSMGTLLDRMCEQAEHAGRLARQASNLLNEANDFAWDGRHDAAGKKRRQARQTEAEYARVKNHVADLRKQALDRYTRFAGPQAVNVVDLRTGMNDRHELREAAE